MGGTTWYVRRRDKELGPFTASQLKQLAYTGKLRATDLVRRSEMANWVTADRVQGLIASAPINATIGSVQAVVRPSHATVEPSDARVNRWPSGVKVVSGLGPFGEYETAFIQVGKEILWINGKQTSSHIVVGICSILMTSLFCLPVGIIMLFVVPFDLTIAKRNREAVWNDFLNSDLIALRKHRTYCKRFAISELSSVAFNEANDKLYVRFGLTRKFKITCDRNNRAEFRAFTHDCRQISRAKDSLFFQIP